jgi:hypothetical protein
MRISDGAIGTLGPDPEKTLGDFKVFESVVSRFTKTMAARTGLDRVINPMEMRKAHTLWSQNCTRWLVSGCMPVGTTELSHFKTFGLLLDALSSHAFVTFSHSPNPHVLAEIYGELTVGDESQTQLFMDGQHHYVSWIFCYEIVEAYERARTDRRTKYVSRITEDFELDMVSFLIAGNHSADSLYIIMKALFFRE